MRGHWLDAPFGAPPPSAFSRAAVFLSRGGRQNSGTDAPRERFVIAGVSEAIQLWCAGPGLLRRGACRRAGHFGPVPSPALPGPPQDLHEDVL